jgi:hypothetical protein
MINNVIIGIVYDEKYDEKKGFFWGMKEKNF